MATPPRLCNRLLVLLFLALLAGPSIAAVFRLQPMGGLDEKRALAGPPSLAGVRWTEAKSVAEFARASESYFGDHFGLRKLLVGGYRLVGLHVLGLSLNPAVVVGSTDGHRRWLYYHASAAHDGVGLEGLLGQKPYSQPELAVIAANLSQQAKLLAQHRVKVLYVGVPDKQTIYPEYLPRQLRPSPAARSRLDQLTDVAQQVLGSAYLDLRWTLLRAKAEGLMYFPQDTHWTPAAAFIVYGRLIEALRLQDPTRTALPQSAFKLAPSAIFSIGDLSDLAGLPPIAKEPLWMPELTAALPPGHQHGKLLMYCDSYFREFLARYLEAEFDQVKVLYGAYRAGAPIVTEAGLDAEKPDQVIIESAERFWTM